MAIGKLTKFIIKGQLSFYYPFSTTHKKTLIFIILNRMDHHLLVTDIVIYLIHTDSNHLKKKSISIVKIERLTNQTTLTNRTLTIRIAFQWHVELRS